MTQIEVVKAQAANLMDALAARGFAVTKGIALELIAAQYGQTNWDTMAGLLNRSANRQPIPADYTDYRVMPDAVTVWEGGIPTFYQVVGWTEELVAFLHDEAQLKAFLEANQQLFPAGMDEDVLTLEGDGRDLTFSAAELVNMTFTIDDLGGEQIEAWQLVDKDWLLQIHAGSMSLRAKSKEGHAIPVPMGVKSHKGFEILQLTSADGDFYDKYVLVPPHLKMDQVQAKVQDEINRLRSCYVDDDEEINLRTADLKAFVEKLGGKWFDSLPKAGNFDS